mmetsp:Transcript_95582/g.160526  ORF Transcript_95582/g.160526 Transcript_95582/m.160526 type:complete len:259 (+) Transcript_95582:2-778(+)
MVAEFAAKSDCMVLDLCCGNGSDMFLWATEGNQQPKAKAFVGADINLHCLLQARRTVAPTGLTDPKFVEADCFSDDLTNKMVQEGCNHTFNVATCFFAVSLAFGAEEKVRHLLNNVSSKLQCGGVFMGTVMDANLVVKRLRNSRGSMEFGNGTTYNISFKDKPDKCFPKSRIPVGYEFEVRIHNSAAKEFLVVWPYFVSLAEEYRLKLKWQRNVHELFSSYSRSYEDLYMKHKIREIPEAEWELAYLHKAFVFEKIGN